MTGTPPTPASPRGGNNGGSLNGGKGVVAGALDLSKSLVGALPPAFLLLLLLNAAFVGLLVWFLGDQLEQRDKMAQALFDRCMAIALGKTP
jgi:hypothetical protein